MPDQEVTRVDDQWISPSGSQASAADQLGALQRAQDSLWVKLRGEDDPQRRMELLAEFGENRLAIERLTESVVNGSEPTASPNGDPTAPIAVAQARVEVNPATDHEPVAELPESDHVDPPEVDVGVDVDVEARIETEDEVTELASADSVVRPLSFNDTGELVEISDPEPDDDVTVDSSSFDRRGGLASSIFGGAELADGSTDATSEVSARSEETESAQQEAALDRGRVPDPERASDVDNHIDDIGDHGTDEDVDLGRYSEDFAGDFTDYFGGDEPADSSPFESQAESAPRSPVPSAFDSMGLPPYAEPADSDPAAISAHLSSRGPAPTSQYPAIRPPREPARKTAAQASESESPRRALMLLAGLVAVLGVSWILISGPSGEAPTSAASEPTGSTEMEEIAGPSTDSMVDEITLGLQSMGLQGVGVEQRGAVIYLMGSVPTAADREVAIRAAQQVAAEQPINASELVAMEAEPEGPLEAPDGRAVNYQNELSRIVASTPIIFAVEQTEITDLHARILNSVASVMKSYPDIGVTIVGFTDDTGSDESNRQISLRRAESVKAYLVAQGVADAAFSVDAQGEETSSGAQALANLERRVEFRVDQPQGAASAAQARPVRIAIVTPSAANDLAFSQSMVDALNVVAAERGNIEVVVSDGLFVTEDAVAAIRGYAAEGYDLVIAHGSQYGNPLYEIAPEFPEVSFAWGTASDTFGFQNVYAYDAAAQEGGYVIGSMAALLTSTGVLGMVGPIELGDAKLYTSGFRAGALDTKADANVLVTYTDSFSDLTLSAEAASAHVAAGADVMTGSSQMVVGAVSVASENGTLWFGTQSSQTSLAPSLVVASQVYHWEVILRSILTNLDNGVLGGQSFTADLANGGVAIEYNPDFVLPEAVRARADQVTAGIIDGAIVVPVN